MNWLGSIAEVLNDNQGVLTAAIFALTVTYGVARSLVYSRNPEAPTYGQPRLLRDTASQVRGWASKTWQTRPALSTQTITIAYLGFAFDYLPLFIARRHGFFSRLPREVRLEFRVFSDVKSLRASIEAGEVDFVAASSVPATHLRCSGANISVIATLSAHAQCIISPWPNVSVLRDIKDATIATAEFSSSHFGVLSAFETAGLPIPKTRFQFVGEAEGRQLVRARKVAAWAIWPLHSDYEVELRDAREVIGSEVPIYSVLAAVGNLDDRLLYVAREIRDAVRQAKDWIVNNRDRAEAFATHEFGVPRRVVRSAWRRFSFSASLNEATASDIRANAELMARHGWFQSTQLDQLDNFIRTI